MAAWRFLLEVPLRRLRLLDRKIESALGYEFPAYDRSSSPAREAKPST